MKHYAQETEATRRLRGIHAWRWGNTSKTALGTLNFHGTRRLRDDPTLTLLQSSTVAKLAETNQFWLFVPDQLITERSTVAMDIFGLVITGIPHLLSHFLDSEIDGVKVSTAAHFMVSTANVHGEKLIDDGGLPLNSASLAAVGSEVSALYQELIYQAQQCKKIDKDVRIRFDDLSYAVQAVLRRSAELFKMTFRGVQRSRINLSQYKLTWDFANLAKGTVGKLDTSFVSGSSGTGSLPSSPSTGSEAQSMQPTFGPRDEENDLRFSQDSQDVVSTAVDAVICFHTQGTPLTFHDGDGNAHRLTYDQLLDQSPDFMEGCHDFVQRLFPLDKESQNVESPVLSVQQIQELPKHSILRAAGIMELFFTYQYEMGNMNGHNNLRVTRILKCLALCGLSREAREFRDFAVGLTGGGYRQKPRQKPPLRNAHEYLEFLPCHRLHVRKRRLGKGNWVLVKIPTGVMETKHDQGTKDRHPRQLGPRRTPTTGEYSPGMNRQLVHR